MADRKAASAGLADTVRALRAELYQAIKDGQDEELRFALGEIELELEVEVSVGGEAGAEVKFGVVTIGGKGDLSKATTHKIKIKMNPKGKSSETLEFEEILLTRPPDLG